MKRSLLYILFIFVTIVSSFGQLHVGPLNISNTLNWNTYDTVYIHGDISIASGGTLNISPNTSGSNPLYVIFMGNFGFNVINGTGSLTVNGTSSRNIIFTADRPITGFSYGNYVFGESGERWQNISFDQCSGGTYLIDHAIIEYGTGNAYASGGAIDIFADNVTVSNTEIRYCTADGGTGGAIAINGGNSAANNVLTNLRIHHNAAGQGGGLWIDAPVPISQCEIYSNSCPYSGAAGIYLTRALIITNSSIYNNYSGGDYGGAGPGSGVWINGTGTEVINSLVYGNTTGVYFQSNGNIANSDVVNNGTGVISATTQTAPIVLNTILWGNTTDQYTGTNIALANCGIQGGFTTGTDGGGNINLNASNAVPTGPNFVTPASDFHIGSWNNPLYDAGAASYSTLTAPASDIEGLSRISTIDIGAYEFVYYRWTGASSTNWATTGNWVGSLASIPTTISSTQVIIPNGCSNYPTTASLTLSSGGRAVVESGASLTVTGATTVNSGCTFTLMSGASSSANFITGSSVTGSFNVELYLTGSTDPVYNWHYVTTPVNGHSKTALTSGIGNTNNLLNYLESAVTTDRMTGWQWHDGYNSTSGFDYLYRNRGYSVLLRNLSSRTALFTGEILGGTDYTFSNLTCGTGDKYIHGWNLIGNPFTAGVDVEAFSFVNVEPTIYYSSGNNSSSYKTTTHESINGAPRYISGMQGFFIHDTVPGGGSLTIPASARLYQTTPVLKGARISSDYPILKFNISDGGTTTDEALIYFFKDATTAFDGKYDAYKLLSENPAFPQIYTTGNNIRFAMNGLALPSQKTEVPLNIRIGEAKNYTINILKLDNLDDYKVILVHGNLKIDLKTNPAYTFSATAGTINNMSIIFENSVTGITVPETDQTLCWYSNGVVSIKAGLAGFEENSSVIIFDLNGKVVYTKNNVSFGKGEIVEIPVDLANGFYITTVYNKNKKLSKKIVITY